MIEDSKIEMESRTLTMPKEKWTTLDTMAAKYTVITSQELIRRCVDAMIKGELHP
jgi:hypothetical protein